MRPGRHCAGAAFGGAKMQNSEIRPFLANVEIKQSFIDFFEIHEKTSEAFATEILSKLDADGLRVEDCRGQTYDNAAVINGRASNGRTDKDSRKESSCLIRSLRATAIV